MEMLTNKHRNNFSYFRMLLVALSVPLAVWAGEYLYIKYFSKKNSSRLITQGSSNEQGMFNYEPLFTLVRKVYKIRNVYVRYFKEFVSQSRYKERCLALLDQFRTQKKQYDDYFSSVIISYEKQQREVPIKTKRRLHHYRKVISLKIQLLKKMLQHIDEFSFRKD